MSREQVLQLALYSAVILPQGANIKRPLAEELLFGKLVQGGTVTVLVKDGKLDLIVEAKEEDDEEVGDQDAN